MADISVSKKVNPKATTARSGASRGRPGYNKFLPLAFLLPSIVVLLLFQFAPALYAVWLSMTRLRRGQAEFIRFTNYQLLFRTGSFIEGLVNTAVYASSFVIATLIIGMFLALLLNQRVKFTGFYLVLIFVPWVLSDVVAGTMWRWMFQPNYGIAQEWLSNYFGVGSLYTDPDGAMFIVIVASVWQALPFTTILSLGALQTVPKEIMEATALDGADRLRRFWLVTLPIIRPTLLVMVLLVSIRAINSVGLIFTTTRGGPGISTQTASVYLLVTGWQQGKFGQGAAVSVIMLGINLVLTLVYLSIIGRQVVED